MLKNTLVYAALLSVTVAGLSVEAQDGAGALIRVPKPIDLTIPREVLNPLPRLPDFGSEQRFRRGDVDSNGEAGVTDGIKILNYLFGGTFIPPCRKAADINDDGRITMDDPIILLGHLFLGKEEPPAPFRSCGVDPTSDLLTCTNFEGCPTRCADLAVTELTVSTTIIGADVVGWLAEGAVKNFGPTHFEQSLTVELLEDGRVVRTWDYGRLAAGQEVTVRAQRPITNATATFVLRIRHSALSFDGAECDHRNDRMETSWSL